jgi:protein-tyrosine phosphatase
VGTVVSTLTQSELHRYGLQDMSRSCKEEGLGYLWWPIFEHGIPADEDAAEYLPQMRQRLADGEHLVIHCRLALGRSPMVAIALLTDIGVPLATAREAVSEARGHPVPDRPAQGRWLRRWARTPAFDTAG